MPGRLSCPEVTDGIVLLHARRPPAGGRSASDGDFRGMNLQPGLPISHELE